MDSNDNEYEYKWVLKDDRSIREISDFKVAKNAFKRSIIKSISEEDAELRDGEPFVFGCYFSTKYDERSITDEEIVIETRTKMLLQYLLYPTEDEELKDEIFRTISKNYSYHGVYESNDDGTGANLSIVRNPHEIIIRLYVDDGAYVNRLETNAFAIEDDDKEYFYISEETIYYAYGSDGSETIEDLISTNITLKRVRSDELLF